MTLIKDIPSTIYKDECGYCFKNEKNRFYNDTLNVLNICLDCFQAFCDDDLHKHLKADSLHTNFLRYYKTEKELTDTNTETEDIRKSKKIKLEVVNELTEEEKYDTFWQIITKNPLTKLSEVKLKSNDTKTEDNKDLFAWIQKVLDKKSNEFQEQDQQWKLEVKTCNHTIALEKNFNNQPLNIPKENIKCSQCELNDNLWICLQCGNLGCGREQIGLKGHSHAVEHQKANSDHCLVVKLGSLSGKNRDIYCYKCDDEVTISKPFEDSFNNNLLANLEMNLRIPTEKTLSELNVEQNMKWDFKMTDSSGNNLSSLSPNKNLGTGLLNLGNSCYFNTIIQAIFNGGIGINDYNILQNDPTFEKLLENVVYVNTNAKIQLNKLIEAIQKNPEQYQNGVKPLIFKKIVSNGNEEFCSGRQQDAMEFFTYFLTFLDEKILDKHNQINDKIFKFNLINKLYCSNGCQMYKLLENYAEESVNIPLDENLECQSLLEKFNDVFATKTTEIDFHCPNCSTIMESKLEFESFPKTLILNPTRIKIENWQPTKTSARLLVPELLNLSDKIFTPVSDELIIKEGDSVEFKPNEELVSQLIEFSGFSRNGCIRALKQTNNDSNLEVALNWMFEHLEDANFNDPLEKDTSAGININPESLIAMQNMGLPEKLCKKGLHLNNGHIEQALDWVFNNMDDNGEIEIKQEKPKTDAYGDKLVSMPIQYKLTSVICHKGNSVHSGHYVIFIKKIIENEERWVLYNDEKIILINELNANEIEDIQINGYIYIYKRL